MELFHVRHRKLIILSAFGGVYLPGLSRIIPWKSVTTFLKAYNAALATSVLLLAIFALKYAIFEANNLVIQIVLLNNVCDDTLALSRVLLWNINGNKAQALYDLWDVYFTGDGHDMIRRRILENLKRPYKKYIIGAGVLICLMMVSWSADQFDNENCEFSVPLGIPFYNRNPEYLIWATIFFVVSCHYAPLVIATNLLMMEPMSWIIAEFMRLRQSLAEILNTIKIKENCVIIQRENGFEEIILNKQELVPYFQQVDKKIKKWITEHQKLLIFHQKMIAVNHWPLTMLLFCSTLTLCLFCYLSALKVFTAIDSFFSGLIYFPSFMLFYIITRHGDLITEQAADVFNSAFTKNWSIYPKHIQRNLHIIAMRANYPLTVNMMKHFPLSSITYFQIIKTAYSIYNFLLFITIKHEIV